MSQVFSQTKASSQLHSAQQQEYAHTSALLSHRHTLPAQTEQQTQMANKANKALTIPKEDEITPVPGVGLLIALVKTLPLAQDWSIAFSNKIQDDEN